jgi:hypothetical protein
VTHPAGTATFSYDAVGNRLSVSGAAGAGTYSSNALNQYTSAGGLGTLTYDANGNLAGGGGWTYSHNSNSRLISANGPGGASASFGRDARNREVKRTLNGVTTYHIYDDWNLVAEYNSTGTLTTRYIHGPRVDEVLAKVTSSGSTYPLVDGLGSTIAVTSPTGAVLERISYTDAYGTPTFQTATGTPLPGTTTGAWGGSGETAAGSPKGETSGSERVNGSLRSGSMITATATTAPPSAASSKPIPSASMPGM